MTEFEEALLVAFSEVLDLSPSASDWLLDLWRVAQAFDDVADGEEVQRGTLDQVIWASMVGMPKNEFYGRHAPFLIPAVALMTLKWMASDRAESEGRADARSYVWRAGYYDVVCLVAALEHGPHSDISEKALSLYGERLDDYLKEFSGD